MNNGLLAFPAGIDLPAIDRKLGGLTLDVTEPRFGAKADGGDDWAAIMRAIDFASPGDTIYFPRIAQGKRATDSQTTWLPTDYMIGKALSVKKPLTVERPGPGWTRLKTLGAHHAFHCDNSAGSIVGLGWRNLQISGNTVGDRGIFLDGANEYTMYSIENVYINGFTDALYVDAPSNGIAINSAFEYSTRGIRVQGYLVLNKCWFESLTTGIEGFGAAFITVIAPKYATVTNPIVATDNFGFIPTISVIGVDDNALPSVASAATVQLRNTGTDFITITGTTTITSIQFSWPGREVTLVFPSACTVVDGSNLNLAGNFVGPGILKLGSDGTNWDEISRSPVGVTRVLDKETTNIDVTLLTTEQTVFTHTIPANLLGTNGTLRLTMIGDYLNNNATSATLTIRIKFGATTLYADTVDASATSASRRPLILSLLFGNEDATNAQSGGGTIFLGTAAGATTGLGDLDADEIESTTPFACIDSTLDTTAAQDLVVTFQLDVNSSTFSVRRRTAVLELL